MSLDLIHAKLYEMVTGATGIPAMTVLNGYSFDWTVRRGGGKQTGTSLPVKSANPTITIRIPDEDNADDKGAVGTKEYIDDAVVTMEVIAPFSGGSANSSDIDFSSDIQYSKAIKDVKLRFGKGSLDPALYGLGVASFHYVGRTNESITEGEKHVTQKAILRFNMKYRSVRWL